MSEMSRGARFSRRDFLLYDQIMAGAPTIRATSEVDALSGDRAASLGEQLTWAQWLREQEQRPQHGGQHGRRIQPLPARG